MEGRLIFGILLYIIIGDELALNFGEIILVLIYIFT